MTLISCETKGPRHELRVQKWTPPGSSERPAKAGEGTARRRRGDEEGHAAERRAIKVKQIEQRCSSCLLLFTLWRYCHFQRARLDCDWLQPSIGSFERQMPPNWLLMCSAAPAVLHSICGGCDSMAQISSDDTIVWRKRANRALDFRFYTTGFVF